MARAVRLIGVDCATDPAKVGLARGVFDDGLTLLEVRTGGREVELQETLRHWLASGEGPVLLAFDAPLGWPAPLGPALAGHRAGAPLPDPPNALFRRETDRFIQRRLGKTPLDVGADRIARTAHAALSLLSWLGSPGTLPLAWDPEAFGPVAVLEVYPAATLPRHGLPARSYKRPDQGAAREVILRGLAARMQLPADQEALRTQPDALDAAICLLAAADFLRGEALPPEDRSLAEREGWIWVRDPRLDPT